jgi:hypothetical protein
MLRRLAGCFCPHCSPQAALGGGVWLEKGRLRLDASNLWSNTAKQAGGAVAASLGSRVEAAHSTLAENSAPLGGAVAAHDSPLAFEGCTLRSNHAAGNEGSGTASWVYPWVGGTGGAVFAAEADCSLRNTSLASNFASQDGGALALVGARADAQGVNCTNNAADGLGGCIAAFSDVQHTLRVAGSNLTSNTAAEGGAVSSRPLSSSGSASQGWSGPVELVDCVLWGNSATTHGGALALNASRQLAVRHSRLASNNATAKAGALLCMVCGDVVVSSTAFLVNTAASCAGASLVNATGDVAISGSTFEGNRAAGAALVNAIPAWDTAGSGGGLCLISAANASILNSTLAHNVAAYGGA